jgi:hypothetical protein
MAMKLPNGTRATNASENMSVFSPHFHKVYNNHCPTDPSILEHVPQCRTMWELDDPINWNELTQAVRKLKNAKAAGLTRVPPKAFKAMQTANRLHIFKYINDFFLGAADYNQWHQSQCVPVPKSGDLSDPNKWRGVMLMDVCSKIFSSVMNKRAFKLLSKHGTKFQFGGTPKLGCQDKLFVLKTMLNMRKNHNLASYIGFVNLVKAYDTANHDLLLDILERYGAPPKFVAAIEKCHQNLIFVLIKKEVVKLPQTIGVRQGDNMAPVLFLFLMSAFAETLETKWKTAGIDVCTVRSITGPELAAGKGKIRGHLPKEYLSNKLTTIEILQCLYVDDGAFIFSSQENMTKGLALIYSHLARFGLEMHISRAGSPSKTECVFFPPPRFFNSQLPLSIANCDDSNDSDNALEYETNTLTKANHHNKHKARKRREQEETLYDALKETQPIKIEDGYDTFFHHFKYLGSYVSFGLTDDYDINTRITAASKSIGALKSVWDSPHLEIWSKYLLFCTILMNLLLWRCKTWAMRVALLNKLEVFLQCNIQRIL